MLDVHAPEKHIGNVKEFFLHLFTITIGLLIAVGIEGCVEWHHHRDLAKEARATMREEITKNSETMHDANTAILEQSKQLQSNIVFLKNIQEHPKDPKAQNGNLVGNYKMVSLQDTGWKTAQITGALSYMPYEEAKRYSRIYNLQTLFQAQEDKLAEDAAQFFGLIRKFSVGKGDITAEQASAIAERMGIWQGHLMYLKVQGTELEEEQKAFLEGREANYSHHENLEP